MGKTQKKKVIVTFRCPVCGDSFDFLCNDGPILRSNISNKAEDITLCKKCMQKGSQIHYIYAEVHPT